MKKWYKIKKYPHIGSQLTTNDYSRIKAYVMNTENVETHSFKPFIKRVEVKRRYRKQYVDGILINRKRIKVLKTREIYFASHLDSMIYSYYSDLLQKKYNKALNRNKLEKVVTAYRRIKKPCSNKGKCNIDFANEVFVYINQKTNECNHQVAIAFDIKGFFDNLNHKKIKKSWASIIEEPLPKHHYQVFKSITQFSFVKEELLFKLFKNQIIVERYKDSYKNEKILVPKKIDKIKYFKEKRAVSFAINPSDMELIRKSGLINANRFDKNGKPREVGIPQGSPISSTLANIYMLEFDKEMNNFVLSNNAIYRRYSDDMLVVCNLKDKDYMIKHFEESIFNICNLEIQQHKTQVFHFINSFKGIVCYQEFETHCTKNRNLEYLGFRFDGENVLLKNSSISSYYRKLKRSINRSKFYAKRTSNLNYRNKIFKSRLFDRYTIIGSHRKRKIVRDKNDKSKFHILKYYNYGNYITYVNKAIQSIKNDGIKKQLKKHWKIFNDELKK